MPLTLKKTPQKLVWLGNSTVRVSMRLWHFQSVSELGTFIVQHGILPLKFTFKTIFLFTLEKTFGYSGAGKEAE